MKKIESSKHEASDFENRVEIEIDDLEETLCRKYYQVIRFQFRSKQNFDDLKSSKTLYLHSSSYSFCQLFVALIANTGMISNGIGVGLSGLVIAQLKDTSNDIKLTLDEESWFGNNIYNNFYKAILF